MKTGQQIINEHYSQYNSHGQLPDNFKNLADRIDEELAIAESEGWFRCYNYVMNKIANLNREESDEKRNKQIN